MRSCATIINSDLRFKHEQMQQDPFLFLRGTYYRWAQLWPTLCKDLSHAPKVLAVGDLHVNSFGTWRDSEGRLCWGVDDFDESGPLSYTNDLVRLATSMKIMIDAGSLCIKLKEGCDAILDGYRQSLRAEGCPVVLAEHEQKLSKLGVENFKPPVDFWGKLNRLPAIKPSLIPDVKRAFAKTMPDPNLKYKVVRRKAGLGSLGQERFVAIADWCGGCIAREAKAVVPSASVWLEGKTGHGQAYYQRTIASAARSHDPFQQVIGRWLIRRLSPDSNPIDIQNLPKQRDEKMLLRAMGLEAGNIHVGTRRQVKNILKDLESKKANWLRRAAKRMAHAVEKDWKEYCKTAR
jgi:Uncharacterized protein conserved in bacteria (DUF2252)